MQVGRLNHVAIAVPDLDKAADRSGLFSDRCLQVCCRFPCKQAFLTQSCMHFAKRDAVHAPGTDKSWERRCVYKLSGICHCGSLTSVVWTIKNKADITLPGGKPCHLPLNHLLPAL